MLRRTNNMTAPIVDLTIAIQDALEDLLDKSFERAYVISNSQKDVPLGKWYIMSAGETNTKIGNADFGQLDIFLVYQKGLPASTSANPDPMRNYEFVDDCLDEVESVKRLFREPNEDDNLAGALTSCGDYGTLAGFSFVSFTNEPMLDPNLFRDNGVFSSIIRLTYKP